jgi:hypothetical protein
MAERVEIIDINLEDLIEQGTTAERTLKDLKDEIKVLRKELDGCALGSDEFADKLEELTKAQTELKNATKTSNSALEGSYDALVQKMSELKKQWRATADEAERSNLGEQIADINSQLKEMDASIGNYQRNVGNYASAFDDVTLKIEGGVARFERFNNVSRSIIGSFDLVEGGLKAIGVESEEVNSLMDTMQGAMMLTNGLNSVKEGVQAFNTLRTSVTSATVAQNALNAAQMANPIGLMVTAVAALIAGITALVVVMGKNREEEENLRKQYELTNKVIEDRVASQELEIQLMEARGDAQADILEKEKEYAELNVKTTKERITALEKELEQTGALRGRKKKLLKEQLDDLREQLKDQEKEVRDANNAILIFDTKTKTEQTKNARELAEERKRLAVETANKEIEEARRAREEVRKTYNDLKTELSEYWLNELQLRGKKLDEWTENSKNVVRKAYSEGLISEQEYLDQIFEIDKVHNDKKKELYADAEKASEDYFLENTASHVEAVKEIEVAYGALGLKIKETGALSEESQKKIATGVNLVGTAFGQTSQLLTTLANNQDKNSKEGFENYKKLSIAAATMSMLQGIISSWTSAMSLPAPLSFITGGVMTAFTTTLGAIQIDQIKKQQYGGNASVTSNASVPAINTSALMGTPINYTTEVQGASAVEDIPQKVYVLETDITDTINKVKVAEDESTF